MKLFKATKGFLVFFVMLCATTNIAFAKNTGDKIKDTIDNISESLKKEIDQLGNDFKASQDYLDNYKWKGMIQGKATSGPITLSNLRLNEHHRATAVLPGSLIGTDVSCFIDPDKASALTFYRVVIGFKGVGPQTTLCNCLGASCGTKFEEFQLEAPTKPGVYEIRFRTVEKLLEHDALNAWKDENGEEPDASTTIGVIVVKS
jgi:DNA-binding ferritin-like protein (Dps family)